MGAALTRLQCTNFTYVSLKLNLTQAALGNWTRCTMPSKAICEQLDECQPEEEGLPPFPTLLRMLEMLFISVMAGVLFGLIMSCCMISFWLTSEVNSEISMTEDERDEKLKQIRRRMQFADIAKVLGACAPFIQQTICRSFRWKTVAYRTT